LGYNTNDANENDLTVDGFDVTGISCAGATLAGVKYGYTGTVTVTKCAAAGQPYIVSGCEDSGRNGLPTKYIYAWDGEAEQGYRCGDTTGTENFRRRYHKYRTAFKDGAERIQCATQSCTDADCCDGTKKMEVETPAPTPYVSTCATTPAPTSLPSMAPTAPATASPTDAPTAAPTAVPTAVQPTAAQPLPYCRYVAPSASGDAISGSQRGVALLPCSMLMFALALFCVNFGSA